MELVPLREPVSALSHAIGFLLSLGGTVYLWKRSGAMPGRRPGLVVFGLCLSLCYASSARYHGSLAGPNQLAWLQQLDHVGIYCLIAGTYTPVSLSLLHGRWRRLTLGIAWLAAAGGSTVILLCGVLPKGVSTTIYLALGWGAIFVYREIVRRHSRRRVRSFFLGGVAYSVGAVINLLRWPPLWEGVFGPHELFHVFVLLGSLCHYHFILTVIVDAPRPEAPRIPGRAEAAHAARSASRLGRVRPGRSWVAAMSRLTLTERRSFPPGSAFEDHH